MDDPAREFDFALVLSGATELTTEIEDALFEAGCDDATLSVEYGRIWLQFSRAAPGLKDAVLSAIRDVRKANVGVDVLRVNECGLVSQAEIARRINRSRQLVFQFISGRRGPGGFPPPVCQVADGAPLWAWCEVSVWLCENDMIPEEELDEAEVIAAVNNALERTQQLGRNPALVDEVTRAVAAV